MTTQTKKRGPVRQFSFQCNSPKTPERKRSLKKQFSEDLVEIQSVRELESSKIRVSLSAKSTKHLQNPPGVKLAWSDTSDKGRKDNDTPQKSFFDKQRPINAQNRIIKQQSLDRNMIFNTRETAKDKVETKQNLSIFLGNNGKDHKDEDLSDSSYSSVDNRSQMATDQNSRRPKLILPLNPNITNNDNVKNVFQKHIRKITKQKSLFDDNCYSPTRSESSVSSTIVVPVIANKSAHKETKIHRQNSIHVDVSKQKESNEINETKIDLSRSSTAATRRGSFQKRALSAVAVSSSPKEKKENCFRPPLIRTPSVPLKQEPPKPKFVASKRRVKTAKAKVRIGKTNDGTDDDELPPSRRNWLKRCVSVNGCEVETMVSLVSPSGSENEEEPPEDKDKQKPENQQPPLGKQEPQHLGERRSFSLRKTVKSVSFQQSTIHAIRSFSASFPSRRGSVATSLFLNHLTAAQMVQVQKIQEKRAPVNAIDDEERVSKRRLIRTKSVTLQKSSAGETTNGAMAKDNSSASANDSNDPTLQKVIENSQSDVSQEDLPDDTPSSFDNSKERQCWDTYCKMNEKGVTISFDTILRGMLTPTEYRLRSKPPSAIPEDNCQIAEN